MISLVTIPLPTVIGGFGLVIIIGLGTLLPGLDLEFPWDNPRFWSRGAF